MDKFAGILAFTQVVNFGGFAAAAREMGCSRSAVNKLVNHLERELGVKLLHRTTRQVSPTEIGMAFYERCTAILTDLEAAEAAASQLKTELRGNLRVNAPISFGSLHLSRAIGEFMEQHPQLHLEITLNDRFVDPIEEGFDLTIRTSQPSESPNLVTEQLTSVPRLLYASPAYLARYGTPTHPQDLQHHICLYGGCLASTPQWKLIGEDGEHIIHVQGNLCSNNDEVLRDAAIAGLGIALLPEFTIGESLQQGTLETILSDYQAPRLSIWMLYPASKHLSTKVRALVEFLQEKFGDCACGNRN
jgi:DNA-binding transcriptional LysR family regulator